MVFCTHQQTMIPLLVSQHQLLYLTWNERTSPLNPERLATWSYFKPFCQRVEFVWRISQETLYPASQQGIVQAGSGFVIKWLCFLGVCLDRCYLVAGHLHLFTTTIFPWWFVLCNTAPSLSADNNMKLVPGTFTWLFDIPPFSVFMRLKSHWVYYEGHVADISKLQ